MLTFQAVKRLRIQLNLNMACVETENKHSKALKQYFMLKFITETLLECKIDRMQLPDEMDSIENSLKALRVRKYLDLSQAANERSSLLNLHDYCEGISLTYTAQKVVREALVTELRKRLVPIVKFIEKMQKDLPDIYAETASETNINSSCKELLTLDSQRRECMKQLGELKTQKIQLLKAALELKLGPQVSNDLTMLHTRLRLNQTKADLLRKYIIHEFVNRSQYSVNAIKEVEGYIDKLLDEQSEEQKIEAEKV